MNNPQFIKNVQVTLNKYNFDFLVDAECEGFSVPLTVLNFPEVWDEGACKSNLQ